MTGSLGRRPTSVTTRWDRRALRQELFWSYAYMCPPKLYGQWVKYASYSYSIVVCGNIVILWHWMLWSRRIGIVSAVSEVDTCIAVNFVLFFWFYVCWFMEHLTDASWSETLCVRRLGGWGFQSKSLSLRSGSVNRRCLVEYAETKCRFELASFSKIFVMLCRCSVNRMLDVILYLVIVSNIQTVVLLQWDSETHVLYVYHIHWYIHWCKQNSLQIWCPRIS